ncbi:MAG: DegV family protein [Cellulosilyticaceae bacterium]
MKIKLITDSASDLPLSYIEENEIGIACLEVNIQGQFIKDDFGQSMPYSRFYELLRAGERTSTSQVNIHTFEELFESVIKEGYAIIYIGLASVLSGTVNSATVARENILEKYPEADISVIDSKSASLGEGLLVHKACEMIKAGYAKSDIVRWLEDNRSKVIHAITVDDLNFLKRGGRISSTTAIVGGLLGIKPSIKFDDEGHVVPGAKLKGSKNALRYLVNQVIEKGVDLEEQTLFICHADAKEQADKLQEMILEKVKVKDVIMREIGTVIGTHGGPGAMGVMFLGDQRE